MNVDAELDAWRREWQCATPALPDLRTKVQHQTRFMRMMLAVKVILTVVIGGWPVVWAARSAEPDVIVLAVATWVSLAAAWAFALKTRKACWTPAAMTTSAFLEISIRRCRAAISGTNFGAVLYFCEFAFCCGWLYHRQFQNTVRLPWTFVASAPALTFVISTPVFVAFVIWYRRKKRSELAYLLDLQFEQAADPLSGEILSSAVCRQAVPRRFPYFRFGRKKGFRRIL